MVEVEVESMMQSRQSSFTKNNSTSITNISIQTTTDTPNNHHHSNLPLLHRMRYNLTSHTINITRSKRRHRLNNHKGFLQRQTLVNQSTRVANLDAAPTREPTARVELLGFLRVPKTGSTAILAWAEIASHHGPHYNCFLGPHNNSNHSSLPSSLFQKDRYLDCPHRVYEKTVAFWSDDLIPTLAHFKHKKHNNNNEQHQGEWEFGLRLFTILRDPFHRLVSYFHYARKIYPQWSSSLTARQNASMLANDLEGWMELLATEPRRSFHLPYQRGALMETDDWDLATHWIQPQAQQEQLSSNSRPHIFVVIQECFEASVWLLAETFPAYFESDATRKYLADTEQQQRNVSPQSNATDKVDMGVLRERAKAWFVNDFTFYQTGVDQFKKRLVTSQVDPAIVSGCLQKLGS